MWHVAEIVEGLGRHGVSVPLSETVVANRALASAGRHLDAVAGLVVTVVPGRSENVMLERDHAGRAVLTGSVARVPWGRGADRLLVSVEEDGAELLVLLDTDAAGVRWEAGQNMAGEPRDSLVLQGVEVTEDAVVVGGPSRERLRMETALLRAAATAGALETALAETVKHVTTREQFGRPLVKFQAVAGLLAVLASEHQSVRVAVDRALAAVQRDDEAAWTRVAVARVIGGRAATEGARIAHQLHAAMGVTREHPLHLSTRRLWSWRDEAGTQRFWSDRLGRWLLGVDAEARWQWVTEQNRHEAKEEQPWTR